MSTTGWPDTPPTRSGTAISDVSAGLSCCIGVLAAYINRLKTGEGEKVDISLVDTMVSSLEIINMIYLCTGRVPDRIGNRYEAIYPYDSFQAKDGMVVIACGNNKLYELLKGIIGDSRLAAPEFSDNLLRVEHHKKLKAILEEWTVLHGIHDIVDRLLTAGIPSAPIYSIDQVVKDPHIGGAREMFVEVEHPKAGRVTLTGSQFKFTNRKVEISRPSPMLGEHTREILTKELNMEPEEYERLLREKVI